MSCMKENLVVMEKSKKEKLPQFKLIVQIQSNILQMDSLLVLPFFMEMENILISLIII